MYQGDNQDELRKMLSQYINLNKDIEQVYVAGNDKNLYKNQIYKWQQTMIQQSVLGIKMRLQNKVVLLLLSHIRQKGNGHIVVTIAKQTEDKNGVVALDLSLDNLLKHQS